MDINRVSGKELRSSLNLLIVAIAFGMVFFTVMNGPALTGFSRKLGAGDLVYSVIMAMPVIGGVLQIFGSLIIESSGRRKPIFLIFGFIHRLTWIPIVLIPLFFHVSSPVVWVIIVLISISSAGNAIAGIAFNSWVGSLVPVEIKGRFFSKRTMIFTITGAVSSLIIGFMIDRLNGFNGYALIFIIAAIFGTIDIATFFWISEPAMHKPQKNPGFLKLILEPFKDKNYIKFIVYASVWGFGVNFAGPFFNVYMLENLGMGFLLISLFCQFIPNIFTIVFVRSWGSLADKFGNKPVMRVCGTIIVFLPFIWLFVTPQSIWIIGIINSLSGILWPGYDMTTFNLSVWLAPEKNRSIYMANFTLITSVVGVALAFVCGGAFMEFTGPLLKSLKIPFLLGQELSNFHLLFLISGLIRLAAMLFLNKGFVEENSSSAAALVRSIKGSAANIFRSFKA